MQKMTGIIIMIGGVFIFIIGLLQYNSNKKTNIQTQIIPETGKSTEIAITEPKVIENDNELKNAIEIVIADGVLTNNEKNIIHKITDRKGLDFNEVIKSVEQQISDSEMESETELVDYNKKQGDDFEKFIVQKFNKKYFTVKEWAGDKYVNGVFAETTTNPDFLIELKVKDETSLFSVECKWRQSVKDTGLQFAGEDQFKRYQKYEKTKNIPVFIAVGIGGNGVSPEHIYIVPLKLLSSNLIYRQTLTKYEKKIESDFFFDMKKNKLE